MHITLETDYAIRILVFLLQQDKRVDANKISEETEVTLRFALKILRKLVAAGFVKSFKGMKGGYEFAKESPSELSLYDVIVAIEGNCFLSRCLDETVGCNRGQTSCCKVRKEFCRISDILCQELKATTFEKFVEA
ncbi:MAG: RrF2 family transcriptional regulator [Massiliimalia sp.]|jgi:Rrf2 family protein